MFALLAILLLSGEVSPDIQERLYRVRVEHCEEPALKNAWFLAAGNPPPTGQQILEVLPKGAVILTRVDATRDVFWGEPRDARLGKWKKASPLNAERFFHEFSPLGPRDCKELQDRKLILAATPQLHCDSGPCRYADFIDPMHVVRLPSPIAELALNEPLDKATQQKVRERIELDRPQLVVVDRVEFNGSDILVRGESRNVNAIANFVENLRFDPLFDVPEVMEIRARVNSSPTIYEYSFRLTLR